MVITEFNDYFQYITGACSVIALILMIAKDIFAEHFRVKLIVLITSLSLLIGSFVAPVGNIEITFTKVLNPAALMVLLLMAVTSVMSVIAHVWMYFIEDDKKRSRINIYASNSAVAFVGFLLIYNVFFGNTPDPAEYTDKEIVSLVKYNLNIKDYRRAKTHLIELQKRNKPGSEYQKEIEAKLKMVDAEIAREVSLTLGRKD